MDSLRQCPPGFAIPSHEKEISPVVAWSNCTIACRNPTYTPSEWLRSTAIVKYCNMIGLPLILVLLVTIFMDPKKRDQIVIICIAVLSGLGSLVMLIPTYFPFYSTLCRTEFVGYTEADGISMCVVQGASLLYFAMSTTMALALKSFQLYGLVVHNRKKIKYERMWTLFVLVAPLVAVAINALVGSFGFGSYYPYCFTVNNANQYKVNIFVYYGPIVFSILLVIGFMSSVIYTIIVTVGNKWNHTRPFIAVNENGIIALQQQMIVVAQYRVSRYLNTLAVARRSILFVLLVLMVWLSVFVSLCEYYLHEKDITASYETWLDCIFTYYYDEHDSSLWISRCGEHPKLRFDSLTTVCGISVQSILVCVAFMPYAVLTKQLIRVWRGCVDSMGMRICSTLRTCRSRAAVAPLPVGVHLNTPPPGTIPRAINISRSVSQQPAQDLEFDMIHPSVKVAPLNEMTTSALTAQHFLRKDVIRNYSSNEQPMELPHDNQSLSAKELVI